MNNIDKITGRIMSDAETEAAHIIKEAEAKCQEIAAAKEEEARSEYWKMLQQGSEAATTRYERLMSMAELEAKKRKLKCKQEIVSDIFTKALAKLSSLEGEGYVLLLSEMAAAASVTGAEEIILSYDDKKNYGYHIASGVNRKLAALGKTAKLSVSEETREISGGLILKDGNVETDCSFKAAIDEKKNELTAQVADILFN